MTVLVADILAAIDELAPFDLAEAWDNVGLLVGSAERPVSSIMVGLDPTSDLFDEALDCGADMLITHHPLIFNPLAAILTDQPDGGMLERAIRHQIAVIGCHTNLDNAVGGVNEALADRLGLVNLQPLIASEIPGRPGTGTGRVGHYKEGLSAGQFTDRLLKVLDLPDMLVAGVLPGSIKKVALCGGSGSGFAQAALESGADVYLSSEVKHSTARWAEEVGFCVIDGTHYGTERPVVDLFAERLARYAEASGWVLTVSVSRSQKPPFKKICR